MRLWKQYKADMTIINGQKLKAPFDKFVEVDLCQRKNRIGKTRNKERKIVYDNTEDAMEETLGHKSSPIKVYCNILANSLVELYSFTITYIDSHVAGKRVGENNSQLFAWH
ncbi:hypothetical protein BDD12DRAFT_885850 [Trichophaea hybrida]|nr:hypothetical protein BDD12DRAFT_885850 [Trichophaea hybrida]